YLHVLAEMIVPPDHEPGDAGGVRVGGTVAWALEDHALATVVQQLLRWAHYGNDPSLYEDLVGTVFNDDYAFTAVVSKRAVSGPQAFVIEDGLSRVLGRQYPLPRVAERLRGLHAQLRGPVPDELAQRDAPPSSLRPWELTAHQVEGVIRTVQRESGLQNVSG